MKRFSFVSIRVRLRSKSYVKLEAIRFFSVANYNQNSTFNRKVGSTDPYRVYVNILLPETIPKVFPEQLSAPLLN